MKAIRIHKNGGPDVLQIDDLPEPSPKNHEVKIQIKASALNHMDLWVRKGVPGMGKLPLVLGCDGSGIIVETGSQVKNFQKGNLVLCYPLIGCGECPACLENRTNDCPKFKIPGEHCDGMHQEFVCVPESRVIKFDKKINFVEAAAFPLTAMTAWHMLVAKAEIEEGETVLVIGANSGVGSFAIQIAKIFGAQIIATASGNFKKQKALELGANHVIDHYQEIISQRVKEITRGRGVDVVFEHVGEKVWQECLQSLSRNGRLVTCGATSGPIVQTDLRHIFIKQQRLIGSTMGTFVELNTIAELISYGKIKVPLAKIFPYTQVKKAHEFLEDLKNPELFGKVVLEW